MVYGPVFLLHVVLQVYCASYLDCEGSEDSMLSIKMWLAGFGAQGQGQRNLDQQGLWAEFCSRWSWSALREEALIKSKTCHRSFFDDFTLRSGERTYKKTTKKDPESRLANMQRPIPPRQSCANIAILWSLYFRNPPYIKHRKHWNFCSLLQDTPGVHGQPKADEESKAYLVHLGSFGNIEQPTHPAPNF